MPFVEGTRFHEDDRRWGWFDVLPGFFGKYPEGELSVIRISKGTVVGWHLHKTQSDFWFVAKGKLLVQMKNEKSGETKKIFLSERTGKALEIPPGWWHGYKCLEEGSVMLEFTTLPFGKDEERSQTRPEEWEIELH